MIAIPLSGRHGADQCALVSPADADLAGLRWSLSNHGYAQHGITLKSQSMGLGSVGQTVLLHRVIAHRAFGVRTTLTTLCDHINAKKLDCRRENLRLADASNSSAHTPAWKPGVSGFRGVHRTRSGRWSAKHQFKKLPCRLGTFDTPEEAAAAYDNFVRLHRGEFAVTNF